MNILKDKLIKILTAVAVSVVLINFSYSYAIIIDNSMSEKPADQAPAVFMEEPVRYMGQVFNNYHNWQIDEGIEKTDAALKDIDELFQKNPNAELKDPKLKLNRAYQIKATLHTLLGMLYHRKSLQVVSDSKNSQFAPILEKLKDEKEITDADLEKLADEIDKDSLSRQKEEYFENARREFQKAISTDPSNPVPHYQLGSIYSAAAAAGQTEDAEREFFMAAKLSLDEDNKESAVKAVEKLRNINPESAYIVKIELLIKEKKVDK